jgi:hypothetical protein
MKKYWLLLYVIQLVFVYLALGETGYPLKNGDFSTYQGFGKPAGWGVNIKHGKPLFNLEISTIDISFKNPGAIATIDVNEGDDGCYFQDISLMPGEYCLNLDLQIVGNVEVAIAVGGRNEILKSTSGWKRVAIEFATESDQRVHLFARGGCGKARFRNVELSIKKLRTSLVPIDTDIAIGDIRLPEVSSEEERFAVYELQYYIWRMTGKVPGLKGRDETFDGAAIIIGKAVDPNVLCKLARYPQDSYIVSRQREFILLSGNTPTGTLYSVYDFLKFQGCAWIIPGQLGEVIPLRKCLLNYSDTKIESPDYDVRGGIFNHISFFNNGGWIYKNADEYFDWAVRNRLNCVTFEYGVSADLGVHRGHGHIQTLNHSWHIFLREDKPEWDALVNGKRMRLHPTGRYNMPCVSNREFRQYVVDYIIRYFTENPQVSIFALSPDDEPAFWCECNNCRKLDSDLGKGTWKKSVDGYPEIGTADRVFNFANEIISRVNKVFPNKNIEVYCYGSYRNPPLREKVDSNILVKYTFWPKTPLNKLLLDENVSVNKKEVIDLLDGWRKVGACHFGLYDYGNWVCPDAPVFWWNACTDAIKSFHTRWNFRHSIGEVDSEIQSAFMWYDVRAEALWNVNIDCNTVIRNICNKFYGNASTIMYDYYQKMEDALSQSNSFQQVGYEWVNLSEFDVQRVLLGQQIIERALGTATDEVTLKRLRLAQYSHDILTMFIIQKMSNGSSEEEAVAKVAFERANNIVRDDNILLSKNGVDMLQSLYLPPIVSSTIMELPEVWDFRVDPNDIGMIEQWFASSKKMDWESISTKSDWTAQGYRYHGTAWYRISFSLSEDKGVPPKAKRAILFEAIDGTAQVFLDGKLIGQQMEPAGKMWNKAFAIQLPENITCNAIHDLVVRVTKTHAAAGIWKPVAIVWKKD